MRGNFSHTDGRVNKEGAARGSGGGQSTIMASEKHRKTHLKKTGTWMGKVWRDMVKV